MESLLNKIYVGFEWFVKLTYLQLIFILFTIVGLVIFGIFPALAALMSVVRQWLRGTTDKNVFKTFYGYFRQYLIQGNILGYLLVFLTSAFVIYIYWFSQVDHLIGNILIFIVFFILFFVLVLWIYWLPILVHYELKGFQHFKYALLIGLMRPLHTISFVLFGIVIYYWSRIIPGLIPIVNMSILGIGWMFIALNAFKKFDEKIHGYSNDENLEKG